MYKFYGQSEQDKFIFERYFKDKKNGISIECGAFDGIMESSTLFFEENLEWTCINIEASPPIFEMLKLNRDKSFNFNLGLGNKEIAKMAAEQTAIRQKLEQMRNELNKEGKGLGNKLNPLIKELEEQERSLINKSINRETINRQRDILTRLLESEKALLERGFEEKRESKSGKDLNNGNKIIFEEYNKEKLKQVELLRSIDPNYRKYFKDKANQYFNQN